MIKKVTRKHDHSEYFLKQCGCCNMMFYRRGSQLRGDTPVFYNKNHYKRKLQGITGMLTDEDLKQPACTDPGTLVVWRKEDELPYSLCTKLNC